jgi:hypothetical protein
MNPMSIMASAEKLSVPELQRSIQSGVVPAFIGVPLLQEKVKRAKQMQMGMAAQQPKRPSVAEQVGQEARQASVEDMMRERARMMQGEMGQTGGISDFLPKPTEEAYAKGGPIAFAEKGYVDPDYLKAASDTDFDIWRRRQGIPGGQLPFSEDQLPQSGARATMPSAALYGSDLGIDEASALRALTPAQREYYSMFPNGKALAVKHGMQELSKQPGAFVGTPDVTPSKHTSKVPYYKTEAPQPKDASRMSLEDFVNRKGAPTPEWYTEGGKYADKAGDYLTRKGAPTPEWYTEGGKYADKAGDYLTRKGVAGTAIDASKKAYLSGKNVIQGAGESLSEGYDYAAPIANRIMWGTEGQAIPQGTKPTINPKDLVTQARAKPFGESNLPMLEGYGNNLMPVAIDRRAPEGQPAPVIGKAELVKPQIGGADQRTMVERMQLRPAQVDRTAPVMGGNAPTADTLAGPSRTPHEQALQPSAPAVGAGAPPAQQAQPQQQEEKDQSLSDYMKQYREVTGENKGIGALQNRLSEREARLAKEEDRAPWMALMQAGLATMAGTSPFALSNIGQGGVAGLQAYTRSMNKLEDAKDKSFEIQAKLEEAQRAEELAAGKYGLESVQADKKAKQVAQLEREKMAAQKAMNDADNAARLQVEQMQVGASKYAVDARNAAYDGTGKPTKMTDQQHYFSRVVEALEANPTWRPDLRHADGSPNPIAIEAERKKTSTDRRMEGFMGDSMGTSMGSGMMSTQPDPRYRILSQQ